MKKALLLLCCVFPILNGCTPAVTDGGGGAVTVSNKRSFKTMNQDRHVTERAQTLIDHSRMLKGRSHISVATFNHLLLLIGQAQTPELRDYAYKLIAGHIKNVQRIYNEITISGASSLIERTNDTWLTTKVRSAMLATKHLHAAHIKVVTEASTVYLLGLVTHQQGKLAANTARRVTGVKKIVKVFQYAQNSKHISERS